MPLALSYFAPRVLQGARLEWRIDQWPSISGSFDGIAARPGQLVHLGTAGFVIPQLNQSTLARLEVRLLDDNGGLLAANEQEFYAFPRAVGHPSEASIWAPAGLAKQLGMLGYRLADELAQADLAVVDTLTDDIYWYLQDGGRVLWLDATSDSQQTMLGELNIRPRKGRSWQGDWASSMSCASSSSVRCSARAMTVHCFEVMGRFPRSMSEI